MKLNHCTPVLFVRNAKVSRDFYENLLGLTVISDFGGMNVVFQEGLAIWQPDPTNIIPRTLGSEKMFDQRSVSRFEICFETHDLDAIYTVLKAHGVRFLHEVNEELWGQRTIRFYDPDGHLIEVGEAMPVFLMRIYEQSGRDLQVTAQRTFVEPEMLRQFLGLS